MTKARVVFALLLALSLSLTDCAALGSLAPPSSGFRPSLPGMSSIPSGDYGRFYLGLVRSPQGVEGGNGCYDDKGKFVVLINNKEAVDPTYSQLVRFLQQDKTDEFPYQLRLNPNAVYYDKPENLVNLTRLHGIIDGSVVPDPPLICADFAERLHNNAELAGLRCGYVTIDFEGRTVGHAVAVFNTTDHGLVYIDDTGVERQMTDLNISEGFNVPANVSNDKVAYIAAGKAYGLITMENAPAFGTNYTGYENWLVSQHQLDVLETMYKDLQVQIVPLKTQIDTLQARYEALKQQYDQLTGGRTTLPSNIYNQVLPIMNQMKAINDQRNALIDKMNGLVNQLNDVVKQHNDLVKNMGSAWESLGIVSNFFVTWDGEWKNKD